MRHQTLLRYTAISSAALWLGACSKPAPVEQALQTVTAGAVQKIQADTPERYSASIDPFSTVNLAFKSAGIVDSICQVRGADGRMRAIQAGDKVEKDTELARVRTLDYQQHVDQAESQHAQAEAQLQQAQAQLTQARANFSEADIEFTRASNLFQSASLVKPQYDQAKGRYDAGAASVAAAESQVKGAQAGVATAQSAVNQAKLSLSDTSLRAPIGGWIAARNVDNGSIVGNSTVGFTLMDTSLVKAVFAVPDTSLAAIRLGQKQTVTLDALQRGVQGVVTSIAPQADPKARVFAVEVTLENAHELIRPGMIGSLTLGVVHDSTPRLVVPLSAVVRAPSDPNGFAIFRLVDREGKSFVAAQVIQIGQTFGNSIEVTSGLKAGERIVAMGGSLVRDGQEVRVLP